MRKILVTSLLATTVLFAQDGRAEDAAAPPKRPPLDIARIMPPLQKAVRVKGPFGHADIIPPEERFAAKMGGAEGGSAGGEVRVPSPAASSAFSFRTELERGLEEFVLTNSAMSYSDPNLKVRSESDFDEMKEYFLNRYQDLTVTAKYSIGTLEFVCTPINEQPARREARGKLDSPPSPDPDGATEPSILGYTNKNCPTGSVPIDLISLREMSKSPTLSDFMSFGVFNDIDGPAMTAPNLIAPLAPQAEDSGADNTPRDWALVYQLADVRGISADLSIWNPSVQPERSSISQVWLVSVNTERTKLQTVEAGWHIYPPHFGDKVAPFVFSTEDSYHAPRCYNLMCANFVQVTNQPVFAPFAPDRISRPGGAQNVLHVAWYRKPSTGNWWLKMNGVWVGYYPAALFADGPLADHTSFFEFGGEVASRTPVPQMGSGAHASAGFGQAAFASDLRYWDPNGSLQNVDAKLKATRESCYSLAYKTGTAPGTGTYFYFGGPGIADPKCRQGIPAQ